MCISLLVMAFFLATGTAAQASLCCCMKPVPAKAAAAEHDCHKMAEAKHEKNKKECCCESMMGCKTNLGKAILRVPTLNDLSYTKTKFFPEQIRFTSVHPALLKEPPKA